MQQNPDRHGVQPASAQGLFTPPGASASAPSEAARSCLASAAAWRRQALHLREHATAAHLTTDQGRRRSAG
jgi:hypothetical protein